MVLVLAGVHSTRVRNIYWNTTTASGLEQPLTVVVNQGNQAWEYDQVNIICPVYKTGESEESEEQHIIYSVRKEEFEQCRVTSPRPRIVAICNRPRTFMYFTLTFRSFTPTPGGLEFRPGQDYYFVSTSSKLDIHRRVGGYCRTHNMRMVFRVADRKDDEEEEVEKESSPSPKPANFWAKWWHVRGEKEQLLSNYVNVDSLENVDTQSDLESISAVDSIAKALSSYSRRPKSYQSKASPLQSKSSKFSVSSCLLLLLSSRLLLSVMS